MSDSPVRISYFTDVLCIWAYVSQIRVDEIRSELGDRVAVESHFITLFGDTERRIGEGWSERGGFSGYADHVRDVCDGFSHVELHPDVWRSCRPSTSASGHLFLKAVQLLETRGIIRDDPVPEHANRSPFEETAWRVRSAFFRDARDVGRMPELMKIAGEMELPLDDLKQLLDSGEAFAALCRDHAMKDTHRIEGSPTYLLNEGRQKLYGNVGYRIVEANVLELLERPEGRASWC